MKKILIFDKLPEIPFKGIDAPLQGNPLMGFCKKFLPSGNAYLGSLRRTRSRKKSSRSLSAAFRHNLGLSQMNHANKI